MKTLILTDFSEASAQAAQYAAELSRQLHLEKIIVYHSFEITPIASEVPLPSEQEMWHIREKSLESLELQRSKMRTIIGPDTAIEVMSDEMPLLRAVDQILDRENIDLIIIGIAHKSGLEKLLFESHAETLIKESAKPLLVVPLNTSFTPIKNVVYACDFKNTAKSTPAGNIKAFVEALKADLHVLHVDDEREEISSSLNSEQGVLKELFGSPEPAFHFIHHEDTVAGIIGFIKDHDIQLLVSIPRKYPFFRSIFHHSITKDLAFHSPVPLLILKEERYTS